MSPIDEIKLQNTVTSIQKHLRQIEVRLTNIEEKLEE